MTDQSYPIGNDLHQLHAISENLEKQLRTLVGLTSDLPEKPAIHRDVDLHARARRHLQHVRTRASHFPAWATRDGCWSILVDMYAHEVENKKVSVSDACLASGTPPSTALRTIGRLEAEGIVVRQCDEADRRRVFLTLTASARASIADWLHQLEDY